MKVKALLAALVLSMATPAAAFLELDKKPKSMFFAGRCMAPVMLREETSVKDLREMPVQAAVPHLFGESGTVWFGEDPSIVLVDLDAGASCGINVFDEELADVEEFMTYWLDRDDSPFEFTERKEDVGSVRLFYDGFCESCGFNVHARALWLRESKFTVYRVFATLPENPEAEKSE